MIMAVPDYKYYQEFAAEYNINLHFEDLLSALIRMMGA